MARVVGTPKKFTIEGISFNMAADVNISLTPTKEEVTMIATTGKGLQKRVKRIPKAESVTLLVSAEELEQLRSMSSELEEKNFSVTLADGSEWKTQGVFGMESYESEDGKVSITVEPSDDWTVLVA
jgi:hypothetical protein